MFSLVIFAFTCLLWIIYNPFILSYQYLFYIKLFNNYLYFGIDSLSLFFIFLTTFLIPFCILYNWNNIFSISFEFSICIFVLELLLIFLFLSVNILMFYILFEMILIPLFVLVGINNYRKRRIHAAYLLFLYTLFGSLFMLLAILILYSQVGSLNFSLLWNAEILFNKEKLIWLLLFLSFAIKIPILPFHIWLPEAHVEAPTEGSVLLAGIILKLGIYGFLRILIPIFYETTIYFLPLIFTISLISALYTSFTTLRQIDMKRIVAYSSIGHMNIGVVGLFTLKPISMAGSLLLMFSHGIVSGALFLIIGFFYDRFKTKIIKYYSGLVHLMPIMIFIFFLFIMGNISFPTTSSFIGEFLILIDIITVNMQSFVLIGAVLFLCTAYSLLLFNRLSFGNLNKNYINNSFDITRREFNIILPFIFLMFWIGIYPKHFFILIENIIYSYFL